MLAALQQRNEGIHALVRARASTCLVDLGTHSYPQTPAADSLSPPLPLSFAPFSSPLSAGWGNCLVRQMFPYARLLQHHFVPVWTINTTPNLATLQQTKSFMLVLTFIPSIAVIILTPGPHLFLSATSCWITRANWPPDICPVVATRIQGDLAMASIPLGPAATSQTVMPGCTLPHCLQSSPIVQATNDYS